MSSTGKGKNDHLARSSIQQPQPRELEREWPPAPPIPKQQQQQQLIPGKESKGSNATSSKALEDKNPMLAKWAQYRQHHQQQHASKERNKNFRNTSNARRLCNLFARNEDTPYEWTEHLIYTAIALIMQIVLGHDYAFPDGLDETTGKACVNGMNHKMCGMATSLEAALNRIQFLTAFILGGFVVSTVALWRSRRTSYLALCGAVRNMNVNLASILPLPVDVPQGQGEHEHDEHMRKLLHARKTMSRWSLLGYELSVLKARGQIDEESIAVPHLKQLGLLAPGEWQAMVRGDRHTTVWLWLQTMAVELGNEEEIIKLPHTHVLTLCSAVTLIRDRANDLMSSLDHDQPFPYASICGILVNFNLILNATWKGTQWAIWLMEWGPACYLTPQMYIEIFVLLVTSLILGLFYDLLHILYNPFGDRSIDLPHIAVGGGVRKMARAFADADHLPPTMNYTTSSQYSTKHLGRIQEETECDDDDDDDAEVSTDFITDDVDSDYIIMTTRDHLRTDGRGSLFALLSKRPSTRNLDHSESMIALAPRVKANNTS